MLRAALQFLLDRQGSDGKWRDFLTLAGESTDWTTAWVALQLASVGDEAATGAATRAAARALIASQQGDGGWGYHEGVPTDADSTACALGFLGGCPADQVPPSVVARAVACLVEHQQASGGLPTYRRPEPIRGFMQLPDTIPIHGWCSPHVEVTALAGHSLARAGAAEAAAAAWRFVAPRQQESGEWRSYWWTTPHYPTAVGARLAALVGDTVAVARAAGWAAQQLHEPSTTSSAFATAHALATLATAGQGDGSAAQAALDALARLQRSDGGWPSQPILQIPPPFLVEPADAAGWRIDGLGTGVQVTDQHRLFTTATCAAAVAAVAREA